MATSITKVFDLFENTDKVYIKLAYGPGTKDISKTDMKLGVFI
jgi:hypothetical protein